MARRDIIIGLIVVALIGGVIYFSRRSQTPKLENINPTPSGVEERIESKFNTQIPSDVQRSELKDVRGGDASALATRKYADGKFTHVVMADLPDPEAGSYYQAWLVKGNEGEAGYSLVSTGRLRVAKGGWLLEYNSVKDYSDHSKVIVSQETVSDAKIETRVLEGNF